MGLAVPVIKQILKDDINLIDGLDNPRQVKFSADNKLVFVVSADDNSLSIFTLDDNFDLTFDQIFKDTQTKNLPLEGASDLITLGKNGKVLVVSFYDGSISIFNRDTTQHYQFSEAISDNLSYDRVFDGNEPIVGLDTYGLLGAWSIIKSSDEKQVFVASYQSNAVSIFDVSECDEITLNKVITSGYANIDLGNPVSLALSPSNSELFVAGYEKHKLTVFSRKLGGEWVVKQVIQTEVDGEENCLNPQKIVISQNAKVLYLACSGSNTLAVFALVDDNYSFVQTITNSDVGGSGLSGAGSMALSHDGAHLYAAGESDTGMLLFNVEADGKLTLMKRFTFDEYSIEGVSSIAITSDGKHLLLSLAKGDALYMLELQ